MDDSVLHTGLDGIPNEEKKGVFGNEIVSPEVKEQVEKQEKLIRELEPFFDDLIAMIDAEIASHTSIKQFINATSAPEADIRAELRACALYEQYLQELKGKYKQILIRVQNARRTVGK